MGLGRRDVLRAGAIVGGAAASARLLGMQSAQAAEIDPSECPIENIVVLMMENRSFDHMLGRLPGVEGLRREMHNLDGEGNPVYVHAAKEMMITIGDPHHGRDSSTDQFAGGSNGGFVRDSGSQTMTYMSSREIPWMYAAASEYVTFDHWHCGILGPTWPNRSYLHAGTSGGRTSNEFPEGSLGLPERTVWHQLSGAGVDWGIYFTDVPFTALYLDVALRWSSRFKPMQKFYADAAAGRLPPVVHLEPGYIVGTDDHPPANAQAGQRLMHDVVRALQNSPQWPKTALLITYDEHGGFFDHVVPPTMPDDHTELGTPIGFRVPTLLISPWARRGFVGSQVHDHTSALRFIQWRFGLPPLTTRNAAASNILYAFDFSSMRTDLPGFPVPDVDHSLIALSNFNRVVGPADPIHLPGGESPEPENLWIPSAGVGVPDRSTGHADEEIPPPPDMLAAPGGVDLGSLGGGRVTGGQPEMEEALDSGVIPDVLDLRPRPGVRPESPFLDPEQAAAPPAWNVPTRTARRLPRARPATGPERF